MVEERGLNNKEVDKNLKSYLIQGLPYLGQFYYLSTKDLDFTKICGKCMFRKNIFYRFEGI